MDEGSIAAGELRGLLAAYAEWLIVADGSGAVAVTAREIAVEKTGTRTLVTLPFERGCRSLRVRSIRAEGRELIVSVSGPFNAAETLRFVPRTPAGELAAAVEAARLERAAAIAKTVGNNFPDLKPVRSSLNAENGRLAELLFERSTGERVAVLSDVTEKMTPEMLVTTGLLWFERLRLKSKKHFAELWIAAPKKQARAIQKLLALLRDNARAHLRVLHIDPAKPDVCEELKKLKLSDLWRERPPKFSLPDALDASNTAEGIRRIAPDDIDVIHSRHAETMRFRGLPFARVRTAVGREKLWIGIERERRTVTEDNRADLVELISSLSKYRSADSENSRHRCYTLSAESWLESILRRNIKLLDPNIILSPLYNQFRAAGDKIDLLGLRRDGRLVIIELKTSPDREMVLQAADYWRKIEMQRRRGVLDRLKLFGDRVILDTPALVYAVAPALSFHRDFAYFAQKLAPEIELWRFELHEHWRREIKVIGRRNYGDEFTEGR